MKRNALLLCMMLLAAAVFADGLFGLRAGMNLKELYQYDPEAEGIGDGLYWILPNDYQNGDFFEWLRVTMDPERGLVCVEARSWTVETTDDGEELRDTFFTAYEEFVRVMERDPDDFTDYVDRRGQYSYGWSYMVGMFHGDRSLFARWDIGEGGVKYVVLMAQAETQYTGRIVAVFYLDGYEEDADVVAKTPR